MAEAREGIRTRLAAGVAVVLFMATAVSPAAAQPLVTNGSFESGFVDDPNSHVVSYPQGSTGIPGWTVVNSELAWGRNDNPYVGAGATDGQHFLDLTGFDDLPPYGGVTQTITTIPGDSYTLGFDLMSYESDSRYRGPVSATASAGGTSQTFTFTAPAGSTGNQSGHFTLPFTATGTSTPITITGTSAAGGQYLGLDNVTVVPEPAGVGALLCIGMAASARRRRRP